MKKLNRCPRCKSNQVFIDDTLHDMEIVCERCEYTLSDDVTEEDLIDTWNSLERE